MIRILSNGSKWLGQEPDPVDKLLERLATEPLDPTFEHYGDFAEELSRDVREAMGYPLSGPRAPVVRFSGNFANVSAVFSIDTDEDAVIAQLIEAIRGNKATDAYRALRANRWNECRCRKCMPREKR